MTKVPSEISTNRRDEMVCPRCFTEGLEEHPGYIEEYSGSAAMLRATRCPNQACEYHGGVPKEEVQVQYDKPGVLANIEFSGDFTSIAMAAVVVLGIGFLLVNVLGLGLPGFGGGGGADVTVNGEVVTADGEPLPNASVEVLDGDISATSGSEGKYRLANLTDGSHAISINPQEQDLAASTVVLNISGSGEVSLGESNDRVSYENGSLTVGVSEPVQRENSRQVSNGTFILDYENAANAGRGDGVQAQLVPPPSDSVTDSIHVESGGNRTFSIPGEVTGQTGRVTSDIASRSLSQTHSWDNNGSSSLSFAGNIQPDDLVVSVDSNANQVNRNEEYPVSDGDTFTESVNGPMASDLTVTVWGGSAAAPTRTSGTYDGSNPSISIDEDSVPTRVSVTATGDIQTSSRIERGTVSNGAASFEVDGNLEAHNAVISFTGGTPEASSAGDASISVDGSNGNVEDTEEVFTAPSDGTYRLDWDFSVDRNDDLTAAGYAVNGERTEVETGEDSVDLDLSSGDKVSLWAEAEHETESSEKDYTRGHDVYVVSQDVTSDSVEVGETVTLTAELENRGGPYTPEVNFFVDGEVESTDSQYFSSGQTETYRFDVTFDTEGVHTVSINEGEQIPIRVGGASARSGEGSINGDAMRLSDGGTITVDGQDCDVDADGGSCELGELEPGSQQILVTEEGVTDTGFEVRYEARNGARDLNVDIDGDGVTDLEQSGVIDDGQTVSGSADINEAGETPILFDVGNGGSIEYEIEYVKAGQVTEPELYIDGEEVLNESGDINGEKTYTVPALDEGTYEFEVGSANSSNEFNVGLRWTESDGDTNPRMLLDGEVKCQPLQFAGGGCEVSNLDDIGTSTTVSFEGGAPSFEYNVSYTARAVSNEATMSINGQHQTFSGDQGKTYTNGSWEDSTQLDSLTSGTNSVSLSASSGSRFDPGATGVIEYTFTATQPENPKVVVVNSEGERHEKTVEDTSLGGSGTLIEAVDMELPAEWFTRGENEIQFVSSNGGVIDATVTATTSDGGSIRVAEPE